MTAPMEKILVIGSGGAGKSTFARQLGKYLRIDVVHLDALYWKPDWVESSKEEWATTIDNVVRRDAWIMDGNYSGTLAPRIDASDTVIFLDLPRVVCTWRVLKRSLQYRNATRPDMAHGCNERLNLDFLRWIWSYPSRSRPKVLALLKDHGANKQIVHLRTRTQVRKFLANASGCPYC